jgi:hypothetical protein
MNFNFFTKPLTLVILAIVSTSLHLLDHLKHDYPCLFSLAVRLNPMLQHPDPQVY